MPSNIERCYQCGQCTSVCPMAEQEQTYKIRKLLQMEKLGLESEEAMKIPFIFYCTTCYRCQDNCPQGVNIVDGVLEIRAKAVHNGEMLAPHRKVGQMLTDYGHAVPNNDINKEKRINLGLDAMPATVQKSAEQLEDIRTLLHLTGFDELIADEETNDNRVVIQNTDTQPLVAEENV
ncbi:4Fe-4S dicluster domain-containing protein [Methanolobus sp. ZRKC3]|uniref:4Fe-4S dicluster domain-containing protein n=1 Tax=Methanolobus sp. ZRKC3 TaxID=3125786 RepID=UPI0032489A36